MSHGSFAGAVAEHYARFRRGYPPFVIDRLTTALDLDDRSTVLDLGCGTGQLTVPLAQRTRSVLGVDVEADMLRLARETARDAGARNVNLLLGADSDLDALVPLLGAHPFDAVTIGQALHWMNPARLFPTLRQLLRPGGGVAVIANGSPLWLQDTTWSRAVRAHLEAWFDTELTSPCGTDPSSRRTYRRALVTAGFTEVEHISVPYPEHRTFERIVGDLYSAMAPDQLPRGADRERFEQQLRTAVGAEARFGEDVEVSILVGYAPPDRSDSAGTVQR